MHQIIGTCPVCGETLTVTRLHCRSCDTTIEGQFAIGAFERLGPEQLLFAATFIRCEGKLNRMEKELGLSYPTLRARLTELIRALGYEVGQVDEAETTSEEDRRRILDQIAAGNVSPEEAVKMLQGNS